MATMEDRCATLHKRPPRLPSHPPDLYHPRTFSDDLSEKSPARRQNRRHHSMPTRVGTRPGSRQSSQADCSPASMQATTRGAPGTDRSCSRENSTNRSQSLSRLVASDGEHHRDFTLRKDSECLVTRMRESPSLKQKLVDESGSGGSLGRRMTCSILDENQDPEHNRSRKRELSKNSASSRNTGCSSCDAPSLNEMYGFQVGDKVITCDGPDAVGPWRNMGDGRVCGVAWKPGMLDVSFSNGERFPIRAKNLKKDSEEETKTCDAQEGELYSFKIGDVVEKLNESKLPMGGWVQGNGGRGAVIAAGKTRGTILVRFDGIGDRAVRWDRLGHVRMRMPRRDETIGVGAARAQSKSDKEDRSLKFRANLQTYREEAKAKASAQLSVESAYDVEMDSFVRAKTNPWRELGIGIVRRLGDKDDTVWVQFDVTADQWLLKLKDLESVPDPGKAKFRSHKRTVFDA